jgi:hypothetical protein
MPLKITGILDLYKVTQKLGSYAITAPPSANADLLARKPLTVSVCRYIKTVDTEPNTANGKTGLQ